MSDGAVQLQVGKASATLYRGDLRYVTVAGREVLRRVYVTVRDTKWGTLQAVIRGLQIEQTDEGFRVAYRADYRRGDIDFGCDVVITGERNGDDISITYELTGQARHDFETNRVGLCVLHPIEGVRGTPCTITHANGSVEASHFPDDIAPHAPFTDVSAMSCRVDGVGLSIRFEGEQFETEDQRNWSDASYKTYSRPLARSRPYRVREGETVRQRVTMAVTSSDDAEVPVNDEVLRIGRAIGPLPRIGTVMNEVPAASALDALRRLSLAFVRHDARLSDEGWRDRLHAIAALGWPIDLALHVRDAGDLPPAANLPQEVRRITVFEVGRPMPHPAITEAARRLYGRMPIAGGTIGNFTELNRNRPPAGTFDALAYAVTPQVHAMDDWSIMENAAAQGDAVRTARTFAGGTSLAVGPVTLHRSPDPFAAGNDGKPVAADVDGRHAAPFGAAWTIASMKHLFGAGPATICYYEAVGPHGLVAANGTPHPLYEVFAALADLSDGEVLQTSDSRPLQYKAFAVRRGSRVKLFVANVGWEPTTLAVEGRPLLMLPVNGFRVIDLEGA